MPQLAHPFKISAHPGWLSGRQAFSAGAARRKSPPRAGRAAIISGMDKARSGASRALDIARQVLEIEASAVQALIRRMDATFLHALGIILACKGRVIVSGMGKSGHIARKIASTMSSTGTPAYFVHPAEASHGDLGMITSEDVFIALSYSGENQELLTIVPVIKRQGARLISLTGNPQSSLAQASDAHLDAAVDREACPMGLAPTASTTAALALGDALAVALLDAKGFGEEDFARSHPGGNLGRRLLTRVRDIMHTGGGIPAVGYGAPLSEAVLEISRKGLGMTAIVDENQRVQGIYTDGDLRRTLEKRLDFNSTPVHAVMSRNPRSIAPDALAAEAVQLMERHSINQMLVVDGDNRLVGALNMHDLLHAKVI
jgi:arabinose-5-phosphate isomerase